MINNDTDCLLVIDVQNDFCPGERLECPMETRLFLSSTILVACSLIGCLLRIGTRLGINPLLPVTRVTPVFEHRAQPWSTSVMARLIVSKAARGRRSTLCWTPMAVSSSYAKGSEPRSIPTRRCSKTITPRRPVSRAICVGRFRTVISWRACDRFLRGFFGLDARGSGFDVYLVDDACRGVDLDGSVAAMRTQMESVGVRTVNSAILAVKSVLCVE